MPFSKCSQYPVVGRISANGIKTYRMIVVGRYFFFLKIFFLNMNKLKMMKTRIRMPKVMSAWVKPCGA